MKEVRVIARDPQTGKFYTAMRGESGSATWAWVETTPPDDAPGTAGDLVFDFAEGYFAGLDTSS